MRDGRNLDGKIRPSAQNPFDMVGHPGGQYYNPLEFKFSGLCTLKNLYICSFLFYT